MSPGLTFPRAHCYSTSQCTGAVAEMPSVVPLLLLGEGIIGTLKKRNRQTETDRQTDRQTKRQLEAIHLWRPQTKIRFLTPLPSVHIRPHGPDHLPPCGRLHTVDMKYTPLS